MSTATLGVLRATAWSPAREPGAADMPALEALPALQRRRLSRPARLALQVAQDCLAGERADYIVWSSRHGDCNKTQDQLADLARREPLSPTAFSTSVHNAPAGLYSILCQDDTPSSSLSAGSESLSQACWEAAALLGAGVADRVLVVCYDEPALPPYVHFVEEDEEVFALALLVAPADETSGNRTGSDRPLRLSRQVGPATAGDRRSEASAFWTFWQTGASALAHGHHLWERA